jgi:cell division protein FtsZ
MNASVTTQLELRPRITVIGVGGAGGNAVCNMIRAKLEGVEFVVANTDAQALIGSLVDPSRRIQLGLHVTQGLGAGSKPDVGRASAEESNDEIIKHLRGSNMVFITAGMGGGTGTGAAPVIARAAREEGILTVGVVTKPFHFEGSHRSRTAERGIEELQQYVDTLIIIPNQNLFRIANERTTFADAFKMADDVLYSGVRGVTDLMMMPGLINLDFADIRAVMAEMGKAMMGTGEAEGDRRALDAAEAAISNPLLDDVSMKGAKGVLINITGGYDMTLYEVDEAANRIRDEVDPEANIIFGSTFDEKLNGMIRVSVVATGIGEMHQHAASLSSGMSSQTPLMTAAPQEAPSNTVYYGPPSQKPITEIATFGVTTDMVKESLLAESAAAAGNNQDTEAQMAGEMAAAADVHPEPQDMQNPAVASSQPSFHSSSFSGAMPGSSQPQLAVEAPAERRRPTSLFERFTGVSRAKPQPQPQAEQQQQPRTPEQGTSEDLDMLEIPAFLRRGG